jgi:hypothetical protein
MSTFQPGLPEPGEYHPAFSNYVARAMPFREPVGRLNRQLDEITALLQSLEEGKRMHRYAPGKWSAQELLGHVSDSERIFAYRALRIARGDQTPLAGFEENSYVAMAEADRCDWQALVEEFRSVRMSSIFLFAHLPHTAWLRWGTSNDAPITVRACAYIMLGHADHHVQILRERYL